MVINKLRALDSVAYMRFASVYKDFKNLGNFEKELADILDETFDKLSVQIMAKTSNT